MAEARRFLRKIIIIMMIGRLIHYPLQHLQLLQPVGRHIRIRSASGKIAHNHCQSEEGPGKKNVDANRLQVSQVAVYGQIMISATSTLRPLYKLGVVGCDLQE